MWRLSGTTADWNSPPFSARVGLLVPSAGLHEIRIGDSSLAGAKLLCLHTPEQDRAETLADAYSRQDDLVATYAQTAARPVRPQVYWRGLPAIANGRLGGCELIVSAQTSLLGASPAISVESSVPATETLKLVNEQSGRFEPIDPAPSCEVGAGPGAFLFRPIGGEWSYLELIYPSDFAQATLTCEAAPSRVLRLASSLFPESLEKGVIRRGRIRGLFLSRSGDEAAALAAYREFLDSPLPLTT